MRRRVIAGKLDNETAFRLTEAGRLDSLPWARRTRFRIICHVALAYSSPIGIAQLAFLNP
jgi:hypothetical protein